MKTLLSCCIILLVVLVGVQASAQQTLVLFDDFKETFLDPSLWVGIESRQDPGIQMLESVRQIQGGSSVCLTVFTQIIPRLTPDHSTEQRGYSSKTVWV